MQLFNVVIPQVSIPGLAAPLSLSLAVTSSGSTGNTTVSTANVMGNVRLTTSTGSLGGTGQPISIPLSVLQHVLNTLMINMNWALYKINSFYKKKLDSQCQWSCKCAADGECSDERRNANPASESGSCKWRRRRSAVFRWAKFRILTGSTAGTFKLFHLSRIAF